MQDELFETARTNPRRAWEILKGMLLTTAALHGENPRALVGIDDARQGLREAARILGGFREPASACESSTNSHLGQKALDECKKVVAAGVLAKTAEALQLVGKPAVHSWLAPVES